MTQNPWPNLPEKSPYILPEDSHRIRAHNVTCLDAPDCRVNLDSLPEPFIGLPQSASVVLLNLNPGDGESDKIAHSDRDFRQAILRNLRHEYQDYPFYPLNPKFDWTGAGRWWNQHLRHLFDTAGLKREVVARKLCVIEWFPYHSRKACFGLRQVCASQDYSFNLAFSASRSKLVIIMRAANRWTEKYPHFGKLPRLKNPRNPYLSPAGMGDELFWRTVNTLK